MIFVLNCKGDLNTSTLCVFFCAGGILCFSLYIKSSRQLTSIKDDDWQCEVNENYTYSQNTLIPDHPFILLNDIMVF